MIETCSRRITITRKSVGTLTQEAIMPGSSAPIRVHFHWLMKGVSWFGTVFFIFFAWITWTSSTRGPGIWILFVVFALLCAYEVFITSSVIEIDDQSVTRKDVFATYRMQWTEVQSLESNGLTFALLGADKHLSFNLAMAGKGKPEFSAELERIVKQRHIKIQGLSRIYLSQKNTRVT
jgi:hypothetical protein